MRCAPARQYKVRSHSLNCNAVSPTGQPAIADRTRDRGAERRRVRPNGFAR